MECFVLEYTRSLHVTVRPASMAARSIRNAPSCAQQNMLLKPMLPALPCIMPCPFCHTAAELSSCLAPSAAASPAANRRAAAAAVACVATPNPTLRLSARQCSRSKIWQSMSRMCCPSPRLHPSREPSLLACNNPAADVLPNSHAASPEAATQLSAAILPPIPAAATAGTALRSSTAETVQRGASQRLEPPGTGAMALVVTDALLSGCT
ncbi:hypothetical protein COO60DRAFT_1007350 [Scenedesmus sp. NREL 46B-D3]|nr:hypothetical protein COO60DRAFT_1007350 [Scenedesmus sp. NREL 46B-D3]